MENVPSQQKYLCARRAVLRQALDDGVVDLQYVKTDENIADMFTKPLPREKFLRLRDLVLGCGLRRN